MKTHPPKNGFRGWTTAQGGRISRGTRLPGLLGGMRSSRSAWGLRLGPLPPMPKPPQQQAAEGTRRGRGRGCCGRRRRGHGHYHNLALLRLIWRGTHSSSRRGSTISFKVYFQCIQYISFQSVIFNMYDNQLDIFKM